MQLVRHSAIQRALNLPELLSIIFTFLQVDGGRTGLKACARVSQQWSEVALDQIWSQVTDFSEQNLHQLFRILAPMKKVDDEYVRRSLRSVLIFKLMIALGIYIGALRCSVVSFRKIFSTRSVSYMFRQISRKTGV